MLKIQAWRPDTHPGHVVEIEWEYDPESGRDSGREHRGVSVRYPDGTYIHRDTHGPDSAHEHYEKLRADHVVKNRAYSVIVESLPARMKKPILDSDGDPVLGSDGKPATTIKDKHRPSFRHLGSGRYEFSVPGIDEATSRVVAEKLSQKFSDSVRLVKTSPIGAGS